MKKYIVSGTALLAATLFSGNAFAQGCYPTRAITTTITVQPVTAAAHHAAVADGGGAAPSSDAGNTGGSKASHSW